MMKKIMEIENIFLNWIQRHIVLFVYVVVTILALYVRMAVINYETIDFTQFYRLWYQDIITYGGIHAMKMSIGDYPVGYMQMLTLLTYLPISDIIAIKSVPIIFDFIMAILSVRISEYILTKKSVNREQRHITGMLLYFSVLFAPTVLLNASLWGQCDSIYCTFILWAFYCIMKEKPFSAFALLGIAFSFKATTMLFIPIFILVYLRKRNFSALHFFITPIVILIIATPSYLMGASRMKILMKLVSFDASFTSKLTYNFNNIYSFVPDNLELTGLKDNLSSIGVIFTITLLGMMIAFFWQNQADIENENLLLIAMLFLIITEYTFPGIHDRYLYFADVASLIVFFTIGKIKYIYIPVCIISFSLLSYIEYLNLYELDMGVVNQFLGIGYFIFMCVFSVFIYRKLKCKKITA